MRSITVLKSINDSHSLAHGLVSSGLVGALALVNPRKLTPWSRLAYRSTVASFSAWSTWVSIKPRDSFDILGPFGRAAVTIGAAGATLGISEVGETLDGYLHEKIAATGAENPRRWMAAGQAALCLALWQATRLGETANEDAEDPETQERIHNLPPQLRMLTKHLLTATEQYGAPQLLQQLETARLISYDEPEETESFCPDLRFTIDNDAPRAVPGNATFPVIGRFQALDQRTFDIHLTIDDGQLENIYITEGADWSNTENEAWNDEERHVEELGHWPAPETVELLIETSTGYQPLR